jgi:hypothetical protein
VRVGRGVSEDRQSRPRSSATGVLDWRPQRPTITYGSVGASPLFYCCPPGFQSFHAPHELVFQVAHELVCAQCSPLVRNPQCEVRLVGRRLPCASVAKVPGNDFNHCLAHAFRRKHLRALSRGINSSQRYLQWLRPWHDACSCRGLAAHRRLVSIASISAAIACWLHTWALRPMHVARRTAWPVPRSRTPHALSCPTGPRTDRSIGPPCACGQLGEPTFFDAAGEVGAKPGSSGQAANGVGWRSIPKSGGLRHVVAHKVDRAGA